MVGRPILLSSIAVLGSSVCAAPATHPSEDPCAVIGGQAYVPVAQARACLSSFPFNQTLRENVMDVVTKIFNFYTFEDYYYNSPAPFQESTRNIPANIARINSAKYSSDFAFNVDLYNFVNQLNDGHTLWIPYCYINWQNLLPTPIVQLAVNGQPGIYVAPDAVEYISLLGTDYTSYYDSLGFNWQRLAGAQVLAIEGQDPYDYADYIADTYSGNYLDHNVRVNSVFTSYRISGTAFSQRIGILAGPYFPIQDNITFTLIPVNSTKPETVTVPFMASFTGNNFTDSASYWANNCAATNTTNGVDYKTSAAADGRSSPLPPRAVLFDKGPSSAIGLPTPYQPTLPAISGSTGVMRNYILPDNKTGVMFIGSFEGDYYQFQTDASSAIDEFAEKGVDKLIIDITNNGGGYICLGEFLHAYLAGSESGYAGFQSTNRANPLALKIIKNLIRFGINETYSYYTADNFDWLNNTAMPPTYDYDIPDNSTWINGRKYIQSQRVYDNCTPFNVTLPEKPKIPLSNIAIVGNGNCASTCAMFTTVMYEKHGTKMAVFGGKANVGIEYKGMAGNQVLEWADIDSEIKTASLADDPLAPKDLLVDGDFRHNWRTAYSWLDENTPIAYKSEQPQYRFQYTNETYNNPQALWTFAASKLFD